MISFYFLLFTFFSFSYSISSNVAIKQIVLRSIIPFLSITPYHALELSNIDDKTQNNHMHLEKMKKFGGISRPGNEPRGYKNIQIMNLFKIEAADAAENEAIDYDIPNISSIPEKSWQETWVDRAKKASTMSQEEIRLAAKGAGNRDKTQPESPKAKKRRAFAGCREPIFREKADVTEIQCSNRVNSGDLQFILDAMDP